MASNKFFESLMRRHTYLFYFIVFVIGIIIAGLATLKVTNDNSIQQVYSGTLSSIAAALMMATVLFAIRLWFMMGLSDVFLRQSGRVDGSQQAGLTKVFRKMEDYGTEAEWLDLIARAREHVDIMGRTAYGWCRHDLISDLIEHSIIKKGVRFRWLIMGPGNPFLPTLREKDASIGNMLQGKILETTKAILSIKARLPDDLHDHLELRYFNDTPLYFSLTRIDGKLLITHYQSSKNSSGCPMSQVYGIESDWGESHLSEFGALWRNSLEISSSSTQIAEGSTRLDQRILKEFHLQHEEAAKRVIEENRADFSDFQRGWKVLITELLNSGSSPHNGSRNSEIEVPTLRDFNSSGQGSLGCQCWNLQRYSLMLASQLQEHAEQDCEFRFLIICEECGEANTGTEAFLFQLLDLIYRPGIRTRATFPELFARWRDCFEKEDVRLKIRLSCPSIASKHASRRLLAYPFNVYGSSCVSRSILGLTNSPRSPAPHLEVLWDQKVVQEHRDVFDKVWNASLDHQRAILSTPAENLGDFGDGHLFDFWSHELSSSNGTASREG